MKNIVKYTLGLPVLLFITILTACSYIVFIALNLDFCFKSQLIEVWKPYRKEQNGNK